MKTKRPYQQIFGTVVLLLVLVIACNNDDDNTNLPEPPRDAAEVLVEDEAKIKRFLDNHYVKRIRRNLDSIQAPYIEFALKEPNDTRKITDSLEIIETEVDALGITHTLYVLIDKRRSRNADKLKMIPELRQFRPSCVDSVLLHYEGRNVADLSTTNDNNIISIAETIFDSRTTPSWIDLNGSPLPGFYRGLEYFYENDDVSITKNQENGELIYKGQPDVGALIIPSGLGYFAGRTTGDSYQTLLFTFQLLQVNKADSDNDGILDIDEDLDTDCVLLLDSGIQNAPPLADDDTDGDGVANFRDVDDDNDGVLTREEITFKADGTVDKVDFNGDGTPDYLDPRVREVRTEL